MTHNTSGPEKRTAATPADLPFGYDVDDHIDAWQAGLYDTDDHCDADDGDDPGD